MNEDFHGEIKLDVHDSKADWSPYVLKRARRCAECPGGPL
jgi:hypothetical protein